MGFSLDIVILNYNTKQLLRDILPHVIANSTIEGVNIVVADNASSDGSRSMLKSEFPGLEVIEMTENLGYAGGYNEALKGRNAEYFLLLNSDAEPAPGWLEPLHQLTLDRPSLGAAQPKILDHKLRDKFEYAGAAGGYMDHFGFPFCRGRIFGKVEPNSDAYDDARQVFWATGAAFLVKREAWEKAGGLDPMFFAHMEEIDLCWRLQNMGYEVWAVPTSVVFHIGGATLSNLNPRKTFYNFRNGLYMLHKNLPAADRWRVIRKRKLFDGLAGILFLLQGRWKHTLQIWKAHKAYDRDKDKLKLTETPKRLQELEGIFHGSLVFNYFLKGKKKFKDLRF